MKFVQMIPVLPTADMARDVKWYEEKTGFKATFADRMYAGLQRDNMSIHLQWHAGTEDDPLLGGSVIKIFVEDVQSLFNEFVERGTVSKEKLQLNTPWGTNEFGFFDLNQNAIFFVEDL
jgi:hypothetical protein